METETEIAATRGQAQESARESAPAQEIFVTVSDALEYLFCPRFIFFMHCLGIAQREERRYKVLKGRELHESPREGEPGLREKEAELRREKRSRFT